MLVEPVKDLFDAFVIGAVNRLLTVATVENQHFEPGGTVAGESAGVGSGEINMISEPTGMAHHHKNKTRSNTPVWLSLFRGTTCSRRKTGSNPMA